MVPSYGTFQSAARLNANRIRAEPGYKRNFSTVADSLKRWSARFEAGVLKCGMLSHGTCRLRFATNAIAASHVLVREKIEFLVCKKVASNFRYRFYCLHWRLFLFNRSL